jgi:ADP-heptose:LPS heptosyltransferase
LVDLGPHLSDYSDTAFVLSLLDGLISVDTSAIHLAGAMGKPAWLLLPHLPDWRWMLDRKDTPWYPTVELWRQPSAGDWASVMKAMVQRLASDGFSCDSGTV